MTEKIPTDATLFQCWIKKSTSLFEKAVLYAAYVVVGIAIIGFAFYGLIGVYTVISPILLSGVTAFLSLLSTVLTFLFALPWYLSIVLVGVVIGIPTIFIYSFLWCIARELTEEDWKSGTANNFAVAVSFAFAAFAVVFAFAVSFAVVFAFAVVSFAFAVAVDPVDTITIWYYIFRFPGAAWHHRKNKER